jgi:hypothetical protein
MHLAGHLEPLRAIENILIDLRFLCDLWLSTSHAAHYPVNMIMMTRKESDMKRDMDLFFFVDWRIFGKMSPQGQTNPHQIIIWKAHGSDI